MKLSNYSMNYAAAIARGETDVFRFLAGCRALGLEGASLHIRDLPGTRSDVLAKVRRAYLDQGLSISMLTVSTNFGQAAAKSQADYIEALKAVNVAAYLGAPLLRVFAGSGTADVNRPVAAWDQAVDYVRKLCAKAAEVGVPIGLQNHNHGGLCPTGKHIIRFLKAVEHPNLVVVLDCGQFLGSAGASGATKANTRPEELYESIREAAPIARYVRVKFYQPGRDGSEPAIDYDRVLDILRGVHYQGFLDIVYEPDKTKGEPIDSVIPRVVNFLRSRLRSEDAQAAKSPARYAGVKNDAVFAEPAVRTETDVAFLEGPAVDRAGVVYFSDVKAERIYTWDPGRKRLAVFREKSGAANGLIFDKEGRLIACEGAGRVTRTDLATNRVEVLADRYQDRPLGAPNDLDMDSRGRIYFTSRLSNRDPKAGNVNAVYRIEPSGAIARILAAPEIDMPNGIAISPDNTTLYLIDADGREGRARRIRAYALSQEGTVSSERLLYDFAPGRSGDGMSLDAEGNLYVAAGLHRPRGSSETLDTKPGIHVISPEGKLLAFLETPEDTITNCAFGGPDSRSLYITCGKLLLSVRTQIPGKTLE
jgi:gluconolactonase